MILGRVTSIVRDIPASISPRIHLVLRLSAVVGVLLGIETTILHVLMDPLTDVHAYYDAGARLNAGLPLYAGQADTNASEFYRYPPLLAIAFRPLALLPFTLAALIWEAVLLVATYLTLRRLGLRESVVLVACWLALPIMWTLVIGQAQALVTLFLAFGTPVAVALAGNIKVFPVLVALYWVGRRDWRRLGLFAGWMVAIIGVQFVLEPTATVAYLGFLSLDQVGLVENRSLYAYSPRLGRVDRRDHGPHAASRKDALGLACGSRPVGVRHAAAAHLSGIDAACRDANRRTML